jgi:flagellar protein FliS
MWNGAHDAYLENRILSAEPLELVRLLYQAAIAAVREARERLTGGEIAARSRAISKACEIIIELNAALDHSRGGAISSRLAALYQYMLNRLLDANLQQADAPLAEVLGLLTTLAEAWEQTRTPAEAQAVESPWAAHEEPAVAGAAHAWSL